MLINSEWFKKDILPLFQEYKIEWSTFKNGDFGDLERAELEGCNKGVSIDFWSSGWLGIHAYDYKTENTILNVLLEPEQYLEKEKAFKELQSLLKK
jgi:hypothetical protein